MEEGGVSSYDGWSVLCLLEGVRCMQCKVCSIFQMFFQGVWQVMGSNGCVGKGWRFQGLCVVWLFKMIFLKIKKEVF